MMQNDIKAHTDPEMLCNLQGKIDIIPVKIREIILVETTDSKNIFTRTQKDTIHTNHRFQYRRVIGRGCADDSFRSANLGLEMLYDRHFTGMNK
jgi:hypothetical protein